VGFLPIVLQKPFWGIDLKFSEPLARRSNNYLGDYAAVLHTGDSANRFEAALIGACRLFRRSAEDWSLGILGVLQHYLPIADGFAQPT